MNDHPDRSVRALRGLSVDHPAPYGIPRPTASRA
ncbi:hypothetical protein J2Z77_006435 [Streptomyces avidinii]|uniref:Uncharacterized protein n=1 Tax=Streptomyces avidinii TaxID=1895 RepID=A0ABS4LEN4_STRAV|nr:hypothetical protein [Streptomyces avidinii]